MKQDMKCGEEEGRKANGRRKKRKGEREGRKVEKMQGGGNKEKNKNIIQSGYSLIAM